MEKYLEQIARECDLRGLSPQTKKAYIDSMRHFLKFYAGRDPEQLGIPEIKEYLLYLSNERGLEGRSVNRAAGGIKFYYFKVLERNWRPSLIPRRKEKKTVPVILTKDEISRMIHCQRNIKHRAMLMTLYGTGMRNNELRNLKAEDIDSDRMVIHIRNGKGNKDREALLPQTLLEYLRYYWKNNKDDKKNYLFVGSKDPNKPGEKPNKKLAHTAVGYLVKQSAQIAGVKKKSTLTP